MRQWEILDKSVVSVRHILLFARIIKCFLFVFRIFCSHYYPSEYIVIAFLCCCCSKDPAPRENDTERGRGWVVPLLCKVSIQLFGELFGGYTANEGQRESANHIVMRMQLNSLTDRQRDLAMKGILLHWGSPGGRWTWKIDGMDRDTDCVIFCQYNSWNIAPTRFNYKQSVSGPRIHTVRCWNGHRW